MKAIHLYEALPTTPRSAWRLGEIERALRAHEDGMFWESAALAESLGRIGRIAGCLETRASAIVARGCGATFRIETPKGFEEDALAKKLVTDLDAFWWETSPDWVVKSIMRDYVMMGLAYGRLDWDVVDDKWIPRMRPWHMQHLSYDESRRKYVVNTRQGQIAIEDDDPNWYLFEPNGPRSWMFGAVRALSDLALYRNDAFRDWARFCERHGLPILAIEEPEEASKKDKDKFAHKVAHVGAGGILRLPRRSDDPEKGGYDVKFVEPKNAQAWQTFKEFINALVDDMTIRIKGNNLTTSVDGGSFAAANVHQQVDSMLLSNDTNGYTTFVRYRVIVVWATLNYEGFRKAMAPWAIYDASPPQDITKKASAMASVATTVSTLLKDGVRLDVDATLAEFGVKVLPPDLAADDKGPPGAIYKYHLDYGILTTNEIREALGKPPIPGGDVPPTPVSSGQVVDGPAGAMLAALDRAKRLRTRVLASLPKAPEEVSEGFQFLDATTDANVSPVARAIKPDLDAMLAIVKRHSSVSELERAVVQAYQSMSPSDVAKVLEKIFVLAELSGRYSVLKGM